jgi:hypothetical protein
VAASLHVNDAFQGYANGIFSQSPSQCGAASSVNHAILVVG